jgi:hypothetical protein
LQFLFCAAHSSFFDQNASGLSLNAQSLRSNKLVVAILFAPFSAQQDQFGHQESSDGSSQLGRRSRIGGGIICVGILPVLNGGITETLRLCLGVLGYIADGIPILIFYMR